MKRLILFFLLLTGTLNAQLSQTSSIVADDAIFTGTTKSDSITLTASDHSATGSTEDIDWTDGVHDLTLDADATLSFSNLPASGEAKTITLWVRQNATGYFKLIYPVSVSGAPQLNPVPSTLTRVTLSTLDGGVVVEATSSFGGLNGSLPTDDSYTGTTITGLNAGATIAQWDEVVLNSSGVWVLADADGSGTYPAIGLAVTSGTNANPLTVLVQGTVRNDGWSAWTKGGSLYLSKTAGGTTQTAPSSSADKVQVVGIALASKIIYYHPTMEYLTIP